MELPIQVAVRIYPRLPDKIKSDANGNNNFACDIARGEQQQYAAGNKSAPADDEEDGKLKAEPNGNNASPKEGADVEAQQLERCCVQAIPGYLNNIDTTSALMPAGQLNNNGLAAAGLIQVEAGTAAEALAEDAHTSYPVTHALRFNCTQAQIYHQTVFPLICLFLEGFDASIVTYGQTGAGKTYTLYGEGVGSSVLLDDNVQGVVQRCVREIFCHMTNRPERRYVVNIGWVEIVGDDEVIRDLLGAGNVHCASVADVFHWLQIGLRNRDSATPSTSHTLFTLTLEQQWISPEGLIQHRLSTASFSDLCGTRRYTERLGDGELASTPHDAGLQALELVVSTLVDPAMLYCNGHIPYNRTTLTTLLKDSFGGRAQTLLILCVSALQSDVPETVANLQFAFKVQCVRNYVIVNTFSDDNTPIAGAGVVPPAEMPGLMAPLGGGMAAVAATDNFGLHFAASQWCKLVSNAEGLFAKLMASTSIPQLDKEQIAEWLFLKQECEECLSSSDAATAALLLRSHKQLGPIMEEEIDEPVDDEEEAPDNDEDDDEPEETASDPETNTSGQQNSSNDSDGESQRPDLEEQLDTLMGALRHKTDALVLTKYKQFIALQPKAVMESQEECRAPEAAQAVEERRASASGGGRRRSIQPGASISSAELALLKRVATREQSAGAGGEHDVDGDTNGHDDILDCSGDRRVARRAAAANSPLEQMRRQLRKLDAEIEARQHQIQEVEATLQLRQNIAAELEKNSETRSNVKQRFSKKKAKLETDYEKAKKQLDKALLQRKDSSELIRLRTQVAQLKHQLADASSMKHIAGECGAKLKELQQSAHASKKLRDELHKKAKKERKQREQLLTEIRALQEKENGGSRALVRHPARRAEDNDNDDNGDAGDDDDEAEEQRGKTLKARISHLDHVLREKTANLAQCGGGAGGDAQESAVERNANHGEGLRHEIRNLRHTRDHLLDQRCALDRKLKRDKTLTQREERKLLECDEAIEAIDAAIEFKNELICGHKSIDTSERLQREKGEQMLMARLNKLSAEEMRTLLYKYFNKVIDLRDASRKLETQLMQLERERDAWEWKERVLSNAVRQARLEGERNAVLLQRQHEMKLTLMLRHLAAETSASSAASYGGENHGGGVAARHALRTTTNHLALAHAQPQQHQQHAASSTYSDSEYDDYYKGPSHAAAATSSKLLKASRQRDMAAICPSSPTAAASESAALLAKYKPPDKLGKEKEAPPPHHRGDTKHKLFAKFHVLTRYATTAAASPSSSGNNQIEEHNGNGARKKDKDSQALVTAAIPPAQLKRLIATPAAAAKVTRQKNKIIIQDATRKH